MNMPVDGAHSAPAQMPAPMSVTLTLTPEMFTQINRGRTYLEVAKALTIESAEDAEVAATELTNCNKAMDAMVQWKAKFVQPAKEIVANAEALFDPGIDGFKAAVAHLKNTLLDWNRRERERIAEENRKREEEARRARQEAEAKAAAEQARAAELAAAAQREADEAERRRQAAEAEGNARAAAAAAAEAAKAQERASAVVENANVKAAAALTAAASVATHATPSAAPKVAGATVRDNWKAKLDLGVDEQTALARIVVAAVLGDQEPGVTPVLKRPDLLAFLAVDGSALNRTAKTQKTLMRVPGYVAYNDPILASKRA